MITGISYCTKCTKPFDDTRYEVRVQEQGDTIEEHTEWLCPLCFKQMMDNLSTIANEEDINAV